jgi:hypothetical protein
VGTSKNNLDIERHARGKSPYAKELR